jgi:hypothetical protein
MNDFYPPSINRPARDLAQIAAEMKQEIEATDALAQRTVLGYVKIGQLAIEAKYGCSVAGIGWLVWWEQNGHCSERQIQKYMKLAREWEDRKGRQTEAPHWGGYVSFNEACLILAEEESTDSTTYDKPDSSGQVDEKPETQPQESRSGLWDLLPAEARDKLPGAEKESFVAKLPGRVLNHLKNFADALGDFSRCYDLPADADRLGQRLKAVRDWSNEHVPKATLKPRKPPYQKRCNKCLHLIEMTMKDDYSWAPLDLPNDHDYGHWEVIDGVAYFRKKPSRGLRMDHRRTCTKGRPQEPIPE